MTPQDFKIVLIFLRETEKNMAYKESFVIIFGRKASQYWEQFRNFDYNLGVFFSCLPPEDQNKLAIHLSKHYENHCVRLK